MVSALSPAPVNSGVRPIPRETFANGVTIIQAGRNDRVGHEGLLCRGSGWLHHRLRRPTGHRLTTGCISFASETRCEDCPLWAIARALLLYAECGSLVGLAGFW